MAGHSSDAKRADEKRRATERKARLKAKRLEKERKKKERVAYARYVQEYPISWDHEPAGYGLRVKLSSIPGETAPNVLPIPFYFQCPPLETFRIEYAFEHSDYMALRLGEFDRPSGYKLRRIQFQSLFVDYDAIWTNLRSRFFPSAVSKEVDLIGTTGESVGTVSLAPNATGTDVPNPRAMANVLKDIAHAGSPFRLQCYHGPELWGANNYEVNIAATLRDLAVEERSGELETRYVDVTFVEHRLPEVQRKSRSTRTPATVTITYTPAGNWARKSVKVDVQYASPEQQPKGKLATEFGYNADGRVGPTLGWLAKWYYGSSSKWRLIRDANRKTITHGYGASDPVGLLGLRKRKTVKLKIPKDPKLAKDIVDKVLNDGGGHGH